MQEFTSLQECRDRFPSSICTVGNFDGVHRAHCDLLRHVTASARETGAVSLLVTFDPHPARLLHPSQAPALLMTTRQKLELVAEQGIAATLVIPFDTDFAALSPDRFVREILVSNLKVRSIYVGPEFFFGKDRQGDVAALRELARETGPEVHVLPPLMYQDHPISSSRIRADLREGKIESVRQMLGRPYFVDGTVIPGRKKGKEMGFPTANLSVENEMVPPDGVYATEIVRKGRRYGAVTNIGSRPTFRGAGHAVETHILDFQETIYGESIRIGFLARLREEQRFAGGAELREQIQQDIDAARRIHADRE